MNRCTGIGAMFRRDRAEGRAELEEVIRRCRGNIVRTAHELGLGRRHVYRLIYREALWDVVDAARAAAERPAEPDLIRRAREALRRGRHGIS